MDRLTRRERQVLAGLRAGLGDKGIAERLGISEHTARNHVRSIMTKLRAGSRAEAVWLSRSVVAVLP